MQSVKTSVLTLKILLTSTDIDTGTYLKENYIMQKNIFVV